MSDQAHAAESSAPAAGDPSAVAAFITLVACAASVVLALTVGSWHAVSARPATFAAFAVLALVLEAIRVDVYGRGTVSFAGTGLLATGMVFGIGPAAALSVACAAVVVVRVRTRLHRAVFNAANFALSAAAGAGAYHLLHGAGRSTVLLIGPSFVAGVAYLVVNVGLITLAMSLSEGLRPVAVWNERFRWFTPYYLVSGPLALALVLAYERVGVIGMLAFTAPPAMLMLSIRQYVHRTAQSVEEVRQANEELRRANTDLHDLFEFAGGLAAQTHDAHALTAYSQAALERLVGGNVEVTLDPGERPGLRLSAGGRVVGSLLVESGDTERWARLRDAIEPQLATALESAALVEQVRKTHLETIAALSRSMEAKDYYTGSHTERVSSVAVALAKRLGYGGADLDAIEIGALLHDIGKIGIPERILHKEGSLDADEWTVMKQHPVISEYILSEVDLPAIVLQIARHSHERIDGDGYPDGMSGNDIPLPARIVLVADAFDALTSDRPYRTGRDAHAAIEELRAHTGTQFCSQVIEVLEQLYREEPGLLGGLPPVLAVVA
jgi:putative nucleotidyltransferase with HDIG domain